MGAAKDCYIRNTFLRNMVLNFYGRQDELNHLEKRYDSDQFEFVVIYGRRRIGKTTLIKRFLKGKKGLYFLCDKAGTRRNAERFKRTAARFLDEPPIESNDLYDIFENLTNKVKDRAVITLDEFSYLAEKDGAIPSIFQNIVDEILKESRFMLILCGSSMSMMEKGVLSHKSPLYGRKTGHIKLGELNFLEMEKFYPEKSPWENVGFYSVVGGVPHYLEKLSGQKDIRENITEELFSKSGRLYEEIEFLLKEEFREPDIYKAILSAIGSGCTRVVEIANQASIPANDLPKYLKPLLSLGIIRKEYSIMDFKKRKPHYNMMDNLTNFWFTFCEPFKSELELMELDLPLEYLGKRLNSYVGKRFEEIVREQLVQKVIPFKVGRIGKLWYGNIEIDVMATDVTNKRIAFAEIKYQEVVDPLTLRKALDSKIEALPIKTDDISYLFVAKSFKKDIEGCYTLHDLLSMVHSEQM